MKLKTKLVVAGAVGVAVAAAGTVALIKIIKRRARRIIDRKMRTVMMDVLKMQAEDFVPGGKLGQSVFRRYIDGLDNKRLAALCALVQVGYHVKASGINPLHPTKQQIARAVEKYYVEERLAPLTREDLLNKLDTSDAHDALVAAFNILSLA